MHKIYGERERERERHVTFRGHASLLPQRTIDPKASDTEQPSNDILNERASLERRGVSSSIRRAVDKHINNLLQASAGSPCIFKTWRCFEDPTG